MSRYRSSQRPPGVFLVSAFLIPACLIPGIILSLFVGSLTGQDSNPKKYGPKVVQKAESILAEMELRRTGKSIQSAGSAKISRAISGLTRKKRELRLIQQEWNAVSETLAALRLELQRLNAQYGDLNLKLARVPRGNASANNRIVGLINATVARKKALIDQRGTLKEELTKRRAALNQAESDYAETVLSIRTDFDTVREKLESSLKHDQAEIAFRVLNANFATPEAPESETILRSLDKRIERIEQEVFSESIKLDVERNSLYVNVVIGKKTSRMVVDSGASLISLPRQTAFDLGITVPSDAPKMQLVLADGRAIPARGVIIEKVRVGEFEASNVQAAVLDASASEAEPLLGMSFLGNFKFEINSADKTLKLLRIDSD
jgi:clan AA aspartic protease (TIGR02281 family)